MRKTLLLSLYWLLLAATVSAAYGESGQLLRVGTNVWPGYAPLYIAADREDWDDELNVRLVEYPSATEVLRAFRNRSLEAAALTLDEVLTLQASGVPVTVIAVLDVSAGGDVILAKPHIQGFHDLSGKRVGVESSALGAYMLTRALELNGMALRDVDVVHMDISVHERAFNSGDVDAVVTFDPVRARLLSGGAREVFSSREIPGEIVDVLVVHDDALHDAWPRLRELVAGWFRALDFMQREPLAAARFTARRLQATPEEVLEGYQGLELPDAERNSHLLGGELQVTAKRLQEALVENGLLQSAWDIQQLFEAGLLPAL